MTTTTYSLAEYAATILGPGPDVDDPIGSVEPHKLRWLAERLRGERKPALPGFKASRQWRATQAQVDEAIEILTPKRITVPQVPQLSGMTRTSRRRLAG